MQYLHFNQTNKNYDGQMPRGKICKSNEMEVNNNSKKAKRYRSAFTTGQINYLEKQFKKCPYIGNTSRKEVANVLNIPERAIKIWFQNRRMKEKKEVINKEFNLDRQNNSINNVEFTNDSLINVHSLQSTNDRQCSLKKIVSCNEEKNTSINRNNDIQLNYFSNRKLQNTIKHDTSCTNKKGQPIKNETACNSNVTERANQRRGSFNRLYDNKNFIKYLEKNVTDETNVNKSIPRTENKKTYPKCTSTALDHQLQDLPEDLSTSNKSKMLFQQNPPENMNINTAFIPLCNTQNYFTSYVTAGNVIWKPVNVMPIVSPNHYPLTVTDTQLNPISQLNMQKNNCNCNCHLKNFPSYDQGSQKSHLRYVVALPYKDNSN